MRVQASAFAASQACSCSTRTTSDWQDSIGEVHSSNLNNEQQGPEDITDHREQLDTDMPGVWRCQIEPKSDLYCDRSGKLLDHYVSDWIDEADIPRALR